MRNILPYNLFENFESQDIKKDIEFILLDLKDLGLNYTIFGRSKFLGNPHEDWFKNTKVERGFKDYICLSVQTKKMYLDEILNILKECINYMENNGWKYHTKIDRGVSIVDVNLEDIPLLFEDEIVSKYLGQIHIHFWTI
jgi:hypothetical protein